MIKFSQKPKTKTLPSSALVRKPAVAGSFYPGKKEELDRQLFSFLKQSKLIKIKGNPRILIVPHAGTIYSGPIAASGFRQIERKNFSRVILLGASHSFWFDYVALDTHGFWETPLGKVPLDLDFIETLIDKEKKILTNFSPFLPEHCLEIELIFLQKVLKNFKIVPILVSETSEKLINDLAEKLAENFDDQTFLVISTDLSHYPTYEAAKDADEKTIKGILSGKKEIFEKTVKEVENADYPGLETAACGQKGVSVALKFAEILKIKNFQKIKYGNSGEVFGDYSRVVGYVSIIASSKGTGDVGEKPFLDESAQKEALEIARRTLEEFLSKKTIPNLKPKNPSLTTPLGCFTTLRKHGQLRGCIGEFEPKDPLYKVIQRTAISAATSDFRFPPVTADELKDIKIEISVMTPKRKIDDWRKIKLGKQGVVVQKGANAGTFLPQVAQETGWSLEEFLSHLCFEKAGLPSDYYKNPSVSIYTFEVQIINEEINRNT